MLTGNGPSFRNRRVTGNVGFTCEQGCFRIHCPINCVNTVNRSTMHIDNQLHVSLK